MKPKENPVIFLLLLLKFCLPFFLSDPVFELHRDEYLYYEQGRHLAFGYLENPPLIGWLAFISSRLGGGFFWIKFWPSAFGAATLWLATGMAKELGGRLYAQLLAALGVLFSAFLRIHFLFQPNFLDVFFWSLSAYFLIRYIRTTQSRYILCLSLSLVLGWYSKYSVLFFLVALLAALALTQQRNLYLRRRFWTALALGLLLIVPNLLWQYLHRWPLVHHMKELQETQLQHLNRIDFLKEQLLMLLPATFLWLGGLLWLLKNKAYRVLGCCYLFVVVLLMAGGGKGYYALGAYPVLLAAGGVWAEELSIKRRPLRYAFAVLILLLALPFVPLLLPVSPPQKMAAANKKWGWEALGILRWEDGRNHLLQQDFADMLGWKELTQKAEKLYGQQPDSAKASTVVYCANYGLAGAMKYYAKDGYFRNRIVSENGSFLLWAPARFYFKHLIYIDDKMPDANDNVLKRFASVKVIDSCTNVYSRQYGCKIIHFQNASDSAWIIAAKNLGAAKATFTR